MITPLCYFTNKPKEGSMSNHNDPVTDKMTNAIHDKRMDLFFNRHKFSLDDTLCRIYSERLSRDLDRDLCGLEMFWHGGRSYYGHRIFNTIRREITRQLTSKFKITFRD